MTGIAHTTSTSWAANGAAGDPVRQGSAGRGLPGWAGCARAGRPVAGCGRAVPGWQGKRRAEQDADSEGGDGECHRDPGDGSPVTVLPGEHLLRCWHVLAAVQPVEYVQ